MGERKTVTINEMKSYILKHYPEAVDFRRKVCTTMKNNQVVAIYKSLISKKETQPDPVNHQMDIWEWMLDLNEMRQGTGTHSEIRV